MLVNRYSVIYNKIINKAKEENRHKKLGNYQNHHIIPKSIGGSNDKENLVLLTYKEHRVCHCLLIKMQINTINEIKMRHAYGFFNKHSKFNGPRYKRGKDNIFASERIKSMVKIRMTNNNPMFNPESNEKRMKSYKATLKIYGRKPRLLKEKFNTPFGLFRSKKDMMKVLNITEWMINTIFKDTNKFPNNTERKSKKIDHLNIDFNKTWKENGYFRL